MKSFLRALFLLLTLSSNSQVLNWSKTIGNLSPQTGAVTPGHMTTDPFGNIYCTGWFQGSVDFDPSPSNYSLNSASPSCYVCKYSATGTFIWAVNVVNISGSSNGKYAIEADEQGNVFVHGFFSGSCDFNPGSATYSLASTQFQTSFLLKLDANSNFKWVKLPGANITIKEIQADGQGNLITAGTFTGTVDFNWGSGTNTVTSLGSSDGFVNKINSSGNSVSVKQFGGLNSKCYLSKLYTDMQGKMGVCGTFVGSINVDLSGSNVTYASSNVQLFTVHLDSALTYLNSYTLNLANGSSAIGLFNFDNAGNLLALGQFSAQCDFDFSANSSYTLQATVNTCFLLKLNKNGNFQWVSTLETKVYPLDLKTDNNGQIVVAGVFTGTVDSDPGPAINVLDSLTGPCLFWSLSATGSNISAINKSAIVDIGLLPDGALVTHGSDGKRLKLEKYNSLYTGVQEVNAFTSLVNIYPNPCTNVLTVNNKHNQKSYIIVRDMSGRILMQLASDKALTEINVSNLPGGSYNLQVINPGNVPCSTKFIKE